MTTTAIWWLRRDLRLTDNQALARALEHANAVIPVFVLDPALLNSPYVGPKRLAFLLGGLRQLDADLQRRGSRLVVRRGRPVDELAKLLAESGATAIFAEADYSPFARRRDDEVARRLPLHVTDGLTVHPPSAVLKANGAPYTVFTPFSRAWKSLPMPGTTAVLPAPESIPTPPGLSSIPLPAGPALQERVPFIPGEAEARRRLNHFAPPAEPAQHRGESVFGYADGRNKLDSAATSQLSPYLRFGMLSARQAVVRAIAAGAAATDSRSAKGAAAWLNQLIWREFFISILCHFPRVRQGSFRPKYNAIPWDNSPALFAAWCQGRTGYPVVDAAMRQLVQTGWMHNRARMIMASFLVKDLLVDWRWGEQFFMQHLIDGDPAANNGGWQWTAGTGTDAAPYFRVFNPVLQSKKFDPDGANIRRWLPELAAVPGKYIHAPWQMPASLQQEVSCRIGLDYPAPVVDHAQARVRALAAFKQSAEDNPQ